MCVCILDLFACLFDIYLLNNSNCCWCFFIIFWTSHKIHLFACFFFFVLYLSSVFVCVRSFSTESIYFCVSVYLLLSSKCHTFTVFFPPLLSMACSNSCNICCSCFYCFAVFCCCFLLYFFIFKVSEHPIHPTQNACVGW